jgi:hypothetical protein
MEKIVLGCKGQQIAFCILIMEWKVTIEDKPNQRILVRFDPLNEMIHFIGQYKPHNKEWYDFSEETHVMDIDLETLQDLMTKVYNKMKERLVAYDNVAGGFTIIKEIKIQSEESVPITVSDNSVYGSPVENEGRDNV